MSILTIATLGRSGDLLVGGSDQEVAVSKTISEHRDAADEVFRFLIQNCNNAFVDALTRRLIAEKAEKDQPFACALSADKNTRYLLERP
jgi:hypothetical protein